MPRVYLTAAQREEAKTAQKLKALGDGIAIVKVGDTWVFTGEWTMEQMQALKETIESVSQMLALCYVLTAISLLLSLVALVSAAM